MKALMLFVTAVIIFTLDAVAATKGIGPRPVSGDPEITYSDLYDNSYALIIGASNYRNGWPALASVSRELDELEALLRFKEFHVVRVDDPDAGQLKSSVEQFANKYGFDRKNRLLIYFSGHGYSTEDEDKGFLVPVDAPDPKKDRKGFLQRALSMNKIDGFAREVIANHVLFVFDSCFSGMIFKTRSLPKLPPVVKTSIQKPVRMYISSGSAGETVPAKSVFAKLFIEGIDGAADYNHDGYILGQELGMYLAETVPRYAHQTPQYDKIHEYELSRGDFVFFTQKLSYEESYHADTSGGEPTGDMIKIQRRQHKYEPEAPPAKLGLCNSFLAFGEDKLTQLFNIRTLEFENDKLPYYSYNVLKKQFENYLIREKPDNQNILELWQNGKLFGHVNISKEKYGDVAVWAFSVNGKILIGTSQGFFLIYNRQGLLERILQLESSPIVGMTAHQNTIAVSLANKTIYVWKNLESDSDIVDELMLVDSLQHDQRD